MTGQRMGDGTVLCLALAAGGCAILLACMVCEGTVSSVGNWLYELFGGGGLCA